MLQVPRYWLFIIAGLVWTLVGGMLCLRAIVWLYQLTTQEEILFECIGIGISVLGYYFGFSKIVKKNIKRIHSLPERVSVFAFTAMRGYILIGIMITLGIILRALTFPHYYLSIPYTAMGGALLIGSSQFYRQYFLIRAEH